MSKRTKKPDRPTMHSDARDRLVDVLIEILEPRLQRVRDSATPRNGAPKRINYTAAAEMLAVSVGTLRSMVHRRQVPHLRLGGKLVRFDVDVLEAWLRDHSVPASG